MTEKNKISFRDLLAKSKGVKISDITGALGIHNDYTSEVPYIQFPVPGPKGSVHRVAIRFSEPLAAETVGNDTVMLVVEGERTPMDCTVTMSDERTVSVQPTERLSEARMRGELVHIIVTPGVTMADGRPFAGLSFSTVLA